MHRFSVYISQRKVQEIVIGNIIQRIVGMITSAIISYHCKIGPKESVHHALVDKLHKILEPQDHSYIAS